MKFHLSKELKAGLILLLISVTMYWLVYFLKGLDIFNRFTRYRIEYENVEGVSATGPVYIRGLKVGTIKSISYNHEKDLFDVTIQLESRYQIPSNSVAQIYSLDLLGTKAIRIQMGDSRQLLSYNDLIQSSISVDLLGYLSAELPLLKEQITKVITSLDSSLSSLQVILGIQNRENISHTLAYLSETANYFQTIGAKLNDELPQIQSILFNLNQLSVVLESGSSDISSTLSNLSEFSKTLKETNIEEVIRDLDLLIKQVKNPDGTVGKLLYDDEVLQNITRLLQNVDSLVSQIGQNPKKYFRISVF